MTKPLHKTRIIEDISFDYKLLQFISYRCSIAAVHIRFAYLLSICIFFLSLFVRNCVFVYIMRLCSRLSKIYLFLLVYFVSSDVHFPCVLRINCQIYLFSQVLVAYFPMFFFLLLMGVLLTIRLMFAYSHELHSILYTCLAIKFVCLLTTALPIE